MKKNKAVVMTHRRRINRRKKIKIRMNNKISIQIFKIKIVLLKNKKNKTILILKVSNTNHKNMLQILQIHIFPNLSLILLNKRLQMYLINKH